MVTQWSKSVAFKACVSLRRFESGRRQTVTVTACTLWQGSLNLSATSPMTTSDAETDIKLNIYLFYFICICRILSLHVFFKLFIEKYLFQILLRQHFWIFRCTSLEFSRFIFFFCCSWSSVIHRCVNVTMLVLFGCDIVSHHSCN